MRKIIPLLSFLLGYQIFLTAQQRFIIWHDGALEVELMNEKGAVESSKLTKITNSYLLKADDPALVQLKNKESEAVRLKIFLLNTKEETFWQDLASGTTMHLNELLQNLEPQTGDYSDEGLWERITSFYATTLKEQDQKLMASIQQQMERRAASEKASVKKAEGINFKQPLWMELNGPEDLDFSWTSRYPIQSVCLRVIGQAEPIFKVDNLGYYRIHYAGLNRDIREKIERSKRYEIEVRVKDEKGEEKMATTRFFIKKSLDFDPVIGTQFALDKMNLRWSSQYPVTEVMFQDADTRDTLYHTVDLEVIQNIHKISGISEKGGSYQLDLNDLPVWTQDQIKRGNHYELAVAISDARGAKRIYSKRFYCLSNEETIMKGLGDDRDAYHQLVEFAEGAASETPPDKMVVSEPPAPAPSRLNTSPEVDMKKEENYSEEVSDPPARENTTNTQTEEDQPDKLEEEVAVDVTEKKQEDDAPVFYYSFDQPLISDQSGNNFNATGSVLIPDRNGKANQAYRFDGQQDFIALPANEKFVFTEQTPFTLSFWFKSEGQNASLSQFYQEEGAEGTFLLDVKIENGQVVVWCCAKDISCETLFGKKLSSDNWRHLAVSLDEKAYLKLFIDGELVRSRPITLQIEEQNASSLLFGKDQNNQNYLSGGMDEIYLFKRALSAEEIAELAK